MMYPRLRVARTLLRDDGVLLASIGDDEVHNIRAILDEVFGEENFCGVFIWEKKKKPSFLDSNMGVVTEYIVAYARDRSMSPAFVAGTVEDGKMYPFNNAGNAVKSLTFPKGSVRFEMEDRDFAPQDMSAGNIVTELLDGISVRDKANVNAFRLRGEWRYSQAKLNEFVANGDEIVIRKAPFRPNYINRSDKAKKTTNLLSVKGVGMATYEDATAELVQIFGSDIVDYPKPRKLLQFLLSCITSADDLVLDFFSGSASFGDAVLHQNRADGCSRKFMLVQLPEKTPENSPARARGYETVAEIGKERMRRIATQLYEDIQPVIRTLPEDVGFKIFKLSSSHFKAWKDYEGNDLTALQNLFDEQEIPLEEGWTPDGLLTEVLLLEGFPLDSKAEPQPQFTENVVQCVSSPACEHRLWACFDATVATATLEALSLPPGDVFVCLDSALDDNAKLRLTQAGSLKTI